MATMRKDLILHTLQREGQDVGGKCDDFWCELLDSVTGTQRHGGEAGSM